MSAAAIPPRMTQIAMCTASIAQSVDFFTNVFGFGEATGEILTGPGLAQMQELGDNAACIGWWLLGRQELLQVELFQHQHPVQQALPDDWRPCHEGWVRWGVAVPDFDAVLERLSLFGVATLTDPVDFGDGCRRVVLHDPFVGTLIEILEDGPAMPGGVRPHYYRWAPNPLYASVVVADLAVARRFWSETVGLPECAGDMLHTPEMERLWGLDGAEREVAVFDAGSCFIEVIAYRDMTDGKPATDRRLCDQGLQNIALGYRQRSDLDTLVARLAAAGCELNTPLGPDNGTPTGSYTRTPDGASVEVMAILSDFDPYFGFRPRPPSPVKAMLDDIGG